MIDFVNRIKTDAITVDNCFCIIDSANPYKTAINVFEESKTYFPAGGLLVVDDSAIPYQLAKETNTNINLRVQDIHSFMNNPRHFEFLGRPPCIIFVTTKEPEELLRYCVSKTGFHKASEFDAILIREQT